MQTNHLSGLQQSLLKVSFWNSQDLMEVRREMQPIIRRNKNKSSVNDAYKAFGPQRNNNTVKLQVLYAARDAHHYHKPRTHCLRTYFTM